MRPCGATRAGTKAPPLPISIIFFHAIPHKQNNHLHVINPNAINHLHTIHPNETRRGGHTGTAPLPISIIFFHTIPHKQNNHLRAIHPNGIKHPHAIHSNETNRLHAIYPNETVGAVPACPPERSRSGVSIRMFSYTKLLFTSYKICLHATVEDYQKYNFVSFHTPVHYGQHDPNSYAATTAHRKALNCAASLVLYMRWLSSF